MHAESLLTALRAAVEEKATLTTTAAEAASKALERLAQSTSPSPAVPRKYQKKKHAAAASLTAAADAIAAADAPVALVVSDRAGIDPADGSSDFPEGQAVFVPPAPSDLLPDVKIQGDEPSGPGSNSAAPASPTVVIGIASTAKAATDAGRGRKVARLPQHSSSAALRATGTRRLSLTGEGSCGPFAADPLLRLAAAQAAAEETARRAAVAADVVRIFRGEAVQLVAAEGAEASGGGTPSAEVADNVEAHPDPADADDTAPGEAGDTASRGSLRRRSRSLASPASSRAPQRSRPSRTHRRTSDGAALSMTTSLLDSLMRPWRSQEPEAALPVYISCRDLLPKASRRHAAATGGDDAAATAPAPISAAMLALEAFAKSDIAGVRRLLHRVGIDPPASWRPPHAAPSAPAVATRRGGRGAEDATCAAPPLPPGLRQFELSSAEADSASMEAVWLAPGVCGDFVCPTHCCDVCEGGQGGVAAGVFGVGALDAVNSATPLVAPSLPSRLAIDFSSSAVLNSVRSPTAPGTALLSAPVLTKSNRPRKGWVLELVPVQPASAVIEEALLPPRKASRRRSVQETGSEPSEPPAGESSSQPMLSGEASAPTSAPGASPTSRTFAAAAISLAVSARNPASQSGQSPLVLLLYAEGTLTPVRMAAATPALPKALRGLAPGAAAVAAASAGSADGNTEAIVISSGASAAMQDVEAMGDSVVGGGTASLEQQSLVILPTEPSLPATEPLPVESVDAPISPAGVAHDSAGENAAAEDDAGAAGTHGDGGGDDGEGSDEEEGDDTPTAAAAKQPAKHRKRRRGSRVSARKSPTKRPRGTAAGGDEGTLAGLAGSDAADGAPEDAVAVADDPGSALSPPFLALARAWLRREPPHAAPRLLMVEPSRAALVRRLLCGRHRGRLPVRCMHCPRAYHTDCAPPDVALNGGFGGRQRGYGDPPAFSRTPHLHARTPLCRIRGALRLARGPAPPWRG